MLPEQATQHYRGEAGRRYHEQKRALPDAAFPWVARLRAEKLAPFVRATDVVFEYGVGSGWNLAELTCARKIGFDAAEFLAPALSKSGIEFVADTKTLSESSIDVVVCHHTLEHVISPPEALAEIRRLLKPEGRLLLFTPFEREERYEHFDRAEPNHHLYSWNAQTMANLVEECGLAVEKAGVGEFGYSRFAAEKAVRLGLGERGFRALRRLAHWARPGLEVRVIAVKPRKI